MNYTTGNKIYLYRSIGRGRWTRYLSALDADKSALLEYALSLGYVRYGNDAPRGGRLGEHYLAIRPFSMLGLRRKMRAAIRAREAALASMIKTRRVDTFSTISDVGSFRIGDTDYTNHWGDGINTVEVCACDCDFTQFTAAKIITRRQIYNANEPITIVKFDAPKTIAVALCDCNPSFGSRTIENVFGFCIWSQKLKIFVGNGR